MRRERKGRLSSVYLLDESGNGDEYTSPERGYFRVPYEYWSDDWYVRLSLRAKATLLIALSLKQPFVLPAARGPQWYGISEDTIDHGQRELREHEILGRSFTTVDDWLSGTGKRTDYRFHLQAPFHKPRKLAARAPKKEATT